MTNFNFNNKRFILLENSKNGKVNSDTVFDYQQDGNLVTADYQGGTVKYGKIIARLEGAELNMLYQCLTMDNELKAGKALAKITLNKHNKMRLKLDWQWLTAEGTTGTSEYVEM